MASRGLPGSQDAAHAPTARPVAASTLRRGFHHRLDEGMNRAIEAYQNIIASCAIRDRASNARADYQAEVEAANLAKSAEELLRLISELKIAAVVQDVNESKTESNEVRGLLDSITRQSFHDISKLRESVSHNLSALEEHYYNSCARWGQSDA